VKPICAFLLFALTTCAQWIKQPTQGIPRLADQKPNLTASAPRTADSKPDLTGMWQITLGVGYVANVASDLKPSEIQPWAAAIYKERSENLGKDDPWTIQCHPLGTRHISNGGLNFSSTSSGGETNKRALQTERSGIPNPPPNSTHRVRRHKRLPRERALELASILTRKSKPRIVIRMPDHYHDPLPQPLE
jgi:hypothetical protein